MSKVEPTAAKLADLRARNLVSGKAHFVDDRVPARHMLEVALVGAPYARAAVTGIDCAAALAMPGVHTVLTAADIEGVNNLSPEGDEMPLLASDAVAFHGQPVAAVVAETLVQARAAAAAVAVEYAPLPPVLGVEEAIALQSFHGEEQLIEHGDPEADPAGFGGYLAKAMVIAGQEHFALETGVAWAEPGEDGDIRVSAAAEDLGYVRRGLAALLGLPMSLVRVTCPRVGGGYGGKMTGALIPAGVASLAVQRTGLPARVRFDRRDEFRLTGKQNPAYVEFHAGYDTSGRIGIVDCTVYLDGGWAVDRAESVLRNMLRHLDSAYHIPNARFSGRVCRTNLPPCTSTLCDGASIAALVAEEIIAEIGLRLDVIPEAVRQRNLYEGDGERAVTPYGQELGGLRLAEVWEQLIESSDYRRRRIEIDNWNEASRFTKRGLAVLPAKIGCGAPAEDARQASAALTLLPDGSAQVHCGDVELGGAIRSAIARTVTGILGVREGDLAIRAGETDAVGASHYGELYVAAVRDACRQMRERLQPVAVRQLGSVGSDLMELHFVAGSVSDTNAPDRHVPLGQLVRAAIAEDINVGASGFASAIAQSGGAVFREFTCGAAAAEVSVDGFTGEVTVLRADALADVGRQFDPRSEIGQVRGGFMQGLGWLTCEELVWSADGELITEGADSYLVPTAGEAPLQLKAAIMPSQGDYPKEPAATAFCLALSIREAIRDAVAAFGKARPGFILPCPATPEAVYFALHGRSPS